MKNIGIIRFDRIVHAAIFSLASMGWLAAESLPKLESSPETTRLWMGMEEGVIRPAAFQQFRTSSSGYVSIHTANGKLLEQGEHFATIDPDQLELEGRSLEFERTRFERRLKEARRTKVEANMRLRSELNDLEKSRHEFLMLSRSEDVPQQLRKRAASAIVEADEKIKELTELIDPAEIDAEMELEKEDGEIQLARKEKQLLSLRRASELQSAHPGELRIHPSILEKLEQSGDPSAPIWVDANQSIATVVDDSKYEISVVAASPLLGQVPQEELLILYEEGRTGKLIPGEFVRVDEVDNGLEITRNFVFSVEENALVDARNSVGQRNLIHVFRKFPKSYRLVYKKDIAFLAPDVLEAVGWSGLVPHLWPGSNVIQVGPQTIAVEPPNGN